MKKLSSALTAAAIVAGSAVMFAAPAHAGNTDDKVGICHATSAANGHYTFNEVAKDAIAGGHVDHDAQGGDIIPEYSWVDKDRVRQYFPGKNLDKVSYIKFDDSGKGYCEVPKEPAVPTDAVINPPVYIPASCARPNLPYGEVVVPKDMGAGIAGHTDPALNAEKTQWSTQYQLAADTDEIDWSFPAGQTGSFTFNVVPLTADPNYVVDSKTNVGACELPNTGSIVEKVLPYAAGAVGLGALVFGASKIRRRNVA